MRRRVLVVSASMGAGHDGASAELVRRMQARGYEARMVDFLDALPFGLGASLQRGYKLQLRRAPWAYEATYRLWTLLPFLCRPLGALVSLLSGRRLLAWVHEWCPDVIVTTYPLGSLALGRQRLRGKIDVPVVTFVTDFAVHPLWVHRGVDLNLCVHPQSAVVAAARTHRTSLAPGPLVRDGFTSGLPNRSEARQALGLAGDAKAVLVVAGAWGIGEIEATFDAILASGRYTPVAVCGNNVDLALRLRQRAGGIVLGWTDEMPALMAASDALVQNAGGLSCMEAFAAGLPVITFRPIPGHGRQNAEDMERAGVAPVVADADALVTTLDRVTGPAGLAQVAAGRAMFVSDPSAHVAALVAPGTAPAPAPARPRRRRLAAAVGALTACYATLTVGVGTATAHGIGVVHAARHSEHIYVAVRLGDAGLRDPAMAGRLSAAGVTAIVTGRQAAEYPDAVQRLRAANVDLANGGWGSRDGLHWGRARADLMRAGRTIRTAARVPVREFVPCRRIDGFDLASARLVHERVVVPTATISSGEAPPRVKAGHVYLVDGRDSPPSSVAGSLDQLQRALAEKGLALASLSALR